MTALITYEEPKNIREYGVIFLETLLTLWLPKYGVSLEHLESITAAVIAEVEVVLGSSLADSPVPAGCSGPMERALQAAEDFHITAKNGKPIGENEIVEIACGLLCGLISSYAGLDGVAVPESYFMRLVEGKLEATEE